MSDAVSGRLPPSPVVVTLPWHDVAHGAHVGAQRHLRALHRGRTPAHGQPDDAPQWERHIEGALAELAVARWLGVYWNPGPALDAATGDVAGLHVRCTRHDAGHLCLNASDTSAVFVLVTGRAPAYTLRGWLHSDAGRREEWFAERPAGSGRFAFWVPQAELRPILQLRRAGYLGDAAGDLEPQAVPA